VGKVSSPAGGDAITQLILGILSRDTPDSKAREALNRLRSAVVDYNELRVIPPIELAEMLGAYPDVRLKCEDISRSLNKIFALNHLVSLDYLMDLPKKEVRAALDQIDGLEAYTRARVRLLGLHQHAIPLDEAMWAYARKAGIVDRRCSLEQAQAFLERQIAEEDAQEFVALLGRQAWSEMGPAVRRREVEPILSVPPDRTARNMLQMVGASAARADESTARLPGSPAPPRQKKTAKKKVAQTRRRRAAKKAARQKKVRAAGRSPATRARRPAKNKPAKAAKPKPRTAKETKTTKLRRKKVVKASRRAGTAKRKSATRARIRRAKPTAKSA
jgi:hypothetical protein